MARTSYQRQGFLSRDHLWAKLAHKPLRARDSFSIKGKAYYSLFWRPIKVFFGFFLRPKIEIYEDLKKLKGPLIVASNHASWIDPFLIGTAFPRNAKIFPIRYACWHKYFYFPLFTPFVWLFGAFPIKKGIELKTTLSAPIKILKNKGVVGIFPEGKRRKGGRFRKGRRGAAYLSFKTKALILPVKIEGNTHITAAGFFLRRHQVKIKIGKVFSLSFGKVKKVEDFNKPSDYIMAKIREL